MRSVVIHELANAELAGAADWYDEHSNGLGDEFLEAVERVSELMARFPLSFQASTDGLRRGHLH